MLLGEKTREATRADTGCRPDDHLCREQLERMLSSDTFLKAPRLCSLLRYIAQKTLDGHVDDLTEQQIGIHVFQRAPGYNSADDTIVRGSARHLRSRLEQYYREEGRLDPVEISVPKGGYVAIFRTVPVTAADSEVVVPIPPEYPNSEFIEQPSLASWPWQAWATIIILSTSLISVLVVLWPRRHFAITKGPEPAILWRSLFQADRRTIIVPGDAGLDSYIGWENKPVSLLDYTNQEYQKHITVSRPPSMDVPLGVRSVTPMADLRMVSELVRIPSRLGPASLEEQTEVLYARDLTVGDTRDANLILIGAETFNPWVMLYQPQLDYSIQWQPENDTYFVTDRAPKPGESRTLTYRRGVSGNPLTLVALVDNTQGRGNVLLIEGTSMGTTYAALTFLTRERLWKPVIKQATDSSGRLHNFEVLLSSDFVRGGVTHTRLVSIHVH